jgi:hypothetical protein
MLERAGWATVMGLAASVAGADTFTETFDDAVQPEWAITASRNHAITIADGKATFTKSANQPGGGAYLTICDSRLEGDFDFRVKINRTSTNEAGLQVTAAGSSIVEADIEFTNLSKITANVCTPSCSSFVLNTGVAQTTLFIKRVGSTLTLGFAGTVDFPLLTKTAPALSGPLSVKLYQEDKANSNAAYSVWFDDVVITGALEEIGADLNVDGVVDGADLGKLLGEWGDCDGESCCETDINDDGVTDGADLGLMLGEWS